MRKLLLLAGTMAAMAAVPASADAQGRGNGRGQAVRAEQQMRVNTNRAEMRAQARQQARINARRDMRRNAVRGFVDRNRDGIDDRLHDRRGGFVDRNRDGIDDRVRNRYGGAVCPPGLANRTPACVPPGQARRAFREGQVLPRSYRYYTPYDTLINRVPVDYRDDIPVGYNYIYRDNSVYVVDPATRIVRSIINLLD